MAQSRVRHTTFKGYGPSGMAVFCTCWSKRSAAAGNKAKQEELVGVSRSPPLRVIDIRRLI